MGIVSQTLTWCASVHLVENASPMNSSCQSYGGLAIVVDQTVTLAARHSAMMKVNSWH